MYLFQNQTAAKEYFQGVLPEDQEILVMEDDPFLPVRMYSIYEYYLRQIFGENEPYRDIYFPFVQIPDGWQIRGYADRRAKICNEGKVRGYIWIRQPYENGFVSHIDWQDKEERKVQTDFYNRCGYVWKKIYADEICQEKLISYYTHTGSEWLLINQSNGTAMLYEQGRLTGCFGSIREMEEELVRILSRHIQIDDRRDR
ncbi:MAG: hypothetical protein Q4B01_07755 [Eubacteriales bacterium]|nr:hypothetical protein [Eubacteriales bacterium]